MPAVYSARVVELLSTPPAPSLPPPYLALPAPGSKPLAQDPDEDPATRTRPGAQSG